MSVVPSMMWPSSGETKPAIIMSVVVLPEPLGPRKLTNSPASIRNERSRTALVPP